MKQAPTGSAKPGAWRSIQHAWIAVLLLTLASSCGSEEDSRPGQSASSSDRAVLDLLDRAVFVEGTTLPTSQSVQRGMGGWSYEAPGGSRGVWIQDHGKRTFASMVRGSGARLEEPRRIFFNGIGEWDPTLFQVRVAASNGTYIKLRSVIDVDETFRVGPWVSGTIGPEPETVSLPVEAFASWERCAIEFQTDCAGPTISQITLVEERPSSTEMRRVPAGPMHDRRRALGLAAGAVLERRVAAGEGGLVSLAVSADGDSRVRVSYWVDQVSVARAELTATHDWAALTLAIPTSAAAGTLRLEVAEGGAWIAEDRLDPVLVEKPSTVFLVTSDTHRGDHIGAFDESSRTSTPTLDRLAERGLVMTNCFASTNVTNPSHMAVMTGISARDLGIFNNKTALAQSAVTLAELFRNAGYRTFAATSVMHLRPGMSALNQGFDRYSAPEKGKRNGAVALDQILNWLPDAKGQPLFVWLHLYDAHMPYEPPPRLLAALYFEDKDPRAAESNLGIPEEVLNPWILRKGIRDAEYLDALYGASVSYVDELFGRALAEERLGSGIIAFTADHGESLGEDGVFWSHTRLNHSTLHVPLVLTYPDCEPGRTSAPVELIDLGKTLLEAAGLGVDFPGRDLRTAGTDSRATSPRFAISATGWSAAVELGGWMLTLQITPYPMPVSHRNWAHGETELFYLPTDPQAENNVLEANFERSKEMRLALVRWLQSSPKDRWGVQVDISAEARASLEALGYTGDGDAESAESAESLWHPDPDAPWNRRFSEN